MADPVPHHYGGSHHKPLVRSRQTLLLPVSKSATHLVTTAKTDAAGRGVSQLQQRNLNLACVALQDLATKPLKKSNRWQVVTQSTDSFPQRLRVEQIRMQSKFARNKFGSTHKSHQPARLPAQASRNLPKLEPIPKQILHLPSQDLDPYMSSAA